MDESSSLDDQTLNINNDNPYLFTVNKLLYSTLSLGKGLTEIQKIVSEFNIPIDEDSSLYYKRINDVMVPILNLAVQSCEERLKMSSEHKTVGIDGAWNAPKNARFCVVDLIDCETKYIIDFQIISSIDLQLLHPNFTFTQLPPNLFEFVGVDIIADRQPFRIGTKRFVHDGDVKIKNLIIIKKGLPIQEVLDFNHVAKSMFYTASSQSSPLNGLYKILRGVFIHVIKKYPPGERFAMFKGIVTSMALGPKSCWKNRNKESSQAALFAKIEECRIIIEKLNPMAHTNYNESFHALKNHYAPKANEFRKTWPCRVSFSIIAWNHPTNFTTLFRNVLQAPPPTNDVALNVLYSKQTKKMYDKERRQDPVEKDIIKTHKFNKQPSSFTSPFRHKTLEETLPKDKIKKRSLFPKSHLDLGSNWKNRIFFVETQSSERMHQLINEVNPPIFRISSNEMSIILLARTIPNSRLDSFSSARKEGILFHHIDDDTWLDDVQRVNGGNMFEDEELVHLQAVKKEAKKEQKGESDTLRKRSPKTRRPQKPEIMQGNETDTPSAPSASPVIPHLNVYSIQTQPIHFIDDTMKKPYPLFDMQTEDGFNSPITEPGPNERVRMGTPEIGFQDFTYEEEKQEEETSCQSECNEKENIDSGDFTYEEDDFDIAVVKTYLLERVYDRHFPLTPFVDEDYEIDFSFMEEEALFERNISDYEVSIPSNLPCGTEYPFDEWPPSTPE